MTTKLMSFGDISGLIDSALIAKEKKKLDRKTLKQKEAEEVKAFTTKLKNMSPEELTKKFDLPF